MTEKFLLKCFPCVKLAHKTSHQSKITGVAPNAKMFARRGLNNEIFKETVTDLNFTAGKLEPE